MQFTINLFNQLISHSIKADLKDAITKTIQRILLLINYSGNCNNLRVKLSVGFDGSGSHVQRSGRNAKVNTKVG